MLGILSLGLAVGVYARGGNGGGGNGSCGGTPKRDGSGGGTQKRDGSSGGSQKRDGSGRSVNAESNQSANCPYQQK